MVIAKTYLPVREQNKVVHVTQVGSDPKLIFHEMVEPVEVEVGKMLAGQAANGNSLGRFGVARDINEEKEKPEKIGVPEQAGELIFQNLVIDGLEAFPDVEFEKEREVPAESLGLPDGTVSSLTGPTSITVKDEPSLEDRFCDVEDGMMNHPITKVGGADQPLLGIPDGEDPERLWSVALRSQDFLEGQEFFFQDKVEPGHLGLVLLPPECLPGGKEQVLEFHHLFEHMAISLHVDTPAFRHPAAIFPTSFAKTPG